MSIVVSVQLQEVFGLPDFVRLYWAKFYPLIQFQFSFKISNQVELNDNGSLKSVIGFVGKKIIS